MPELNSSTLSGLALDAPQTVKKRMLRHVQI
jgi:hypothetical protein